MKLAHVNCGIKYFNKYVLCPFQVKLGFLSNAV